MQGSAGTFHPGAIQCHDIHGDDIELDTSLILVSTRNKMPTGARPWRDLVVLGGLVLAALGAGMLTASQVEIEQANAMQPLNTGVDTQSIDRNVDPCNDFYQFACGGWMQRHPVPPDLAGIGRAWEMRERSAAVLRRILDTPGADAERQKASDYYKACLDESRLEAAGIRPLSPTLSRIAALRDPNDLPELLAFLHSVAAQPELPGKQSSYAAFFDFRSEHNLPLMVAGIMPGGLALPDRELYLSRDDRSTLIREKYRDHIREVLKMLGASSEEADRGANRVLAIEIALATASPDAAAQRAHDQNLVSFVTLQEMTPHFDWKAYFAASSAPGIATLDVPMPLFMEAFDRIIATTPISDIRMYLTWQVVHASAIMLPLDFRQVDFQFFRGILRGEQQIGSRSDLCLAETDDRLGDVLGKAFVTEAFGGSSKENIVEIVRAIKAAMSRDIDSLAWMSPETKLAAKTKLIAIGEQIGYPSKWKDYSQVAISKIDALSNLQHMLSLNRSRDLKRIGQAVDPEEWPALTVSRGDAGYRYERNDVVFTAGFLQPPLYSSSRDAALNYGSIGAVIGHEITHAFDNEGRTHDKAGNSFDWWSFADRRVYQEQASCLVDQYSRYTTADGTTLDGRLTLNENISDNGGVRLALMAYLVGSHSGSSTVIDGFSPSQRVFLGWAQTWCANVRPDAERLQITTDPHAPNRYRVNGPLSNMPEFQSAFSCGSSAPMVRLTACRIW